MQIASKSTVRKLSKLKSALYNPPLEEELFEIKKNKLTNSTNMSARDSTSGKVSSSAD